MIKSVRFKKCHLVKIDLNFPECVYILKPQNTTCTGVSKFYHEILIPNVTEPFVQKDPYLKLPLVHSKMNISTTINKIFQFLKIKLV